MTSMKVDDQYDGSIVCEVIELNNLPKKDTKKIYIITKLTGNVKGDMATTSCSYSIVNGKYVPKDNRSGTSFESVPIKSGLGLNFEVIVKQTFGKKIVASTGVSIADIPRGEDGKEISCSLTPGGELRVRIKVSNPPAGKIPSPVEVKEPKLSSAQQESNTTSSAQHKTPPPTPSPHMDDKDAEAPAASGRNQQQLLASPERDPEPKATVEPKQATKIPTIEPAIAPTTSLLDAISTADSSQEGKVDAPVQSLRVQPRAATPPPPVKRGPTTAPTASPDRKPESKPVPSVISMTTPLPSVHNEPPKVTQTPSKLVSTAGSRETLTINVDRPEKHPSTPMRHSTGTSDVSPRKHHAATPPSRGMHKTDSDRSLKSVEGREEHSLHATYPSRRHSAGPTERVRRESGESAASDSILVRQNSLKRQGSMKRQDSMKKQGSMRGRLDCKNEDSYHATAGPSSRVSRELIRKLSDSSLQVDDRTECSDNSGGNGLESGHKSLLQKAALSWLEQQVEESGDSTAPPQSARTPVSNKSESPSSTRSTPPNALSPADTSTRRSTRSLFMPAHSTIQEEDADTITVKSKSADDNERIVPFANKPIRRLLSKSDPNNVSSMTVDSSLSDDAANEGTAPTPSLDNMPAKIPRQGRRGSISTTFARAKFDDDVPINLSQSTDADDMSSVSSRPLSERMKIAPIVIEEYDAEVEAAGESGGEEGSQGEDAAEEGDEDGAARTPLINVKDDSWSKRSGSGIRATRRSSSRGSISGRKARNTLTTMRSVQTWDETMSVAEEVKSTMNERIACGDTPSEEFADVGTYPGVECWVIDSGDVRTIDEDDIGTFYDADCYVLLHTSESANSNYSHAVHTWAGSRAQRDKATIAAYKAHELCKSLGRGVHITSNTEGEETDAFIEMLFGNINVMSGSIAHSSLKPVTEASKTDSVRLLEVSAGNSTSVLSMMGGSAVPYMQSIAIERAALKTNSALILDTGQEIIYQWRGLQASHVSRARVFEAAFALRSERIKRLPTCKIEVVDEGSEPEKFWEVFDANTVKVKRSNSVKKPTSEDGSGESAAGSENEEKSEDEESEDDESSYASEDEDAFESGDDFSLVDERADEDEDLIYDMDEIKEYCADQIEGHTEMQRRQVASKSRVLNPDVLDINDSRDEIMAEELEEPLDLEVLRTQVSLYRIGYVEGKLQTSRLCGVNSAGEDFGLPDRALLDTKGVFILDYNEEVYVWMGRNSAGELRNAGTTVGNALVQHSKPEWVNVVTVLEGDEPLLFKTKFPGWHEAEMKLAATRRTSWFQQRATPRKRVTAIVNESVSNMLGYTKKKRHRKAPTKGRMIVRSSVLAYERQPLDDILDQDDGKGVTVIWKIVNAELRSIPRNEHGHFWTHETYVILYGFTVPKPPKEDGDEDSSDDESENAPQFVLYFWQGPHSKEKAYPQWKLGILPGKIAEWTQQMGHIPQEIRIHQGKETPHFFRIFKHRYVVHIAFLGIVKQRVRAEEKVRQVQADILRREKLRWNMLPVPRRGNLKRSSATSPSSSRSLLSIARSSSRQSISEGNPRTPLSRNNSFSSIDSSVADDISTHVSPLPKASFQMETTAGVMLYHIRGLGVCDEDVHAVQIEARASRLNSSDCFVCIRPYISGKTFIWLWVGRGSQFFEQEAAGSIALMIKKWVDENSSRNQVRVVEEGAGEWFNKWIAKSFYKALGGFDLYTNFDLLQTPRYLRPLALRYPQMFLLQYMRGEYTVTMLERYNQYDLTQTGAAIMDAHYALFVWSGKACSASLRVTAIRIAKRFMGSLRKGFRRLDRQVVEVEQGQEPGPFISCFHGWCDWDLLSKPFIDPRTIRFDQRARMGMLGDMANYIGKPIEGLTTEQHAVLATEYKKRLEREKKKAREMKPQKETIRDRVRRAARLKEEEEKEQARLLAGLPPSNPPKLVPDASYRSDYHVPPPDSIYALSQSEEKSVSEADSRSDTGLVSTEPEERVKATKQPSPAETPQTPETPQLDQSMSSQTSVITMSPLTPMTDASPAARDTSADTPQSDFKRLATSVRTPPAKATPPTKATPPRSKARPSLTQQVGLAPAAAKKTPPPRRSSVTEGITQRITHAQPKNPSKSRSSSITSASSVLSAERRRSTSTIPNVNHTSSHTNGGTPSSSKSRSSSLKWSPEEHNGLATPAQRATPRNSIGSASGTGGSVSGPRVAETAASRLRRERNMSKVGTPITPMSLSSSEDKSGRKPYIDYLRQPGPSPGTGEKSITRIITAAGEEVHQRRRSSASSAKGTIGAAARGDERPRRNSSVPTNE